MSESSMATVQVDSTASDGFKSHQHKLTRIDSLVFDKIGGFGATQKWLVFLTLVPALFIGFIRHSDYFYLAPPRKVCTINATLENTTSFIHSPNNSPATALMQTASGGWNPTDRDKDVDHCTGCVGWAYELDAGLKENVVTKWDLVCTNRRLIAFAKIGFTGGCVIGYMVFGMLADWFGRIPVLILSVLFILLFGLSVSFAPSFLIFVLLRFCEGFCLAGIQLCLYLLRIELCPSRWRFTVTMLDVFIVLVGQMLLPIVAFFWSHWWVLQFIIVSPLLLTLPYAWLFPESLRWLLATQQYTKASEWIKSNVPRSSQADITQGSDQLLAELQKVLQKRPKKTWLLKIIGTNHLWKNIVVLCINALTGYGIHHSLTMAVETQIYHKFYANYSITVAIAAMSSTAMCVTVMKMGRRWSLLFFMVVTMLASMLQLGIVDLLGKKMSDSNFLLDMVAFAFSFVGMICSHAVTNLSIFYCAEVTPTVIRAGGVGLIMACANLGILTDHIMDLNNQKGFFLHHVLFLCCTLICFILILLLPESKGQDLPETLVDGDSYTRYTTLKLKRRKRKKPAAAAAADPPDV